MSFLDKFIGFGTTFSLVLAIICMPTGLAIPSGLLLIALNLFRQTI